MYRDFKAFVADAWSMVCGWSPFVRRSRLVAWVALTEATEKDRDHLLGSRDRWRAWARKVEKDNASMGTQVAELALETKGLREQLADAERGLQGIADERDSFCFRIREADERAEQLRSGILDWIETNDKTTERANRAEEAADAHKQASESAAADARMYAERLAGAVGERDAARRELDAATNDATRWARAAREKAAEAEKATSRAIAAEGVAGPRGDRIAALEKELREVREGCMRALKERDDALVVIRAVRSSLSPYLLNDKPNAARY
jgi:chromosome segregation ATPase